MLQPEEGGVKEPLINSFYVFKQSQASFEVFFMFLLAIWYNTYTTVILLGTQAGVL